MDNNRTQQALYMMEEQEKPIRIINSLAPIRICDNGVMTDTWFAEHGKVFNIGVSPYAEVQIEVFPLENPEERIIIRAENYNERYVRQSKTGIWDRHPLLEAAIECMTIPDDIAIHVNIYSEAPGGASTGTSAAITVALIGALDRLTPGVLSTHEIAYLAQSVETKMLNQQCGIQDQLCAAYGGINYIEMFQYPYASVSQVQVKPDIWLELEKRLVLIYLGKPHKSSKMHEKVIRYLEDAGPTAQQLEALRATAEPSRDALYAGDFIALGQAMIQCTDAQQNLHPEIVNHEAQRLIEICKAHGALGWKVNGAGGDGGSLTILCGPMQFAKRAMLREITEENSLFKNIPIHLSHFGLQVWES